MMLNSPANIANTPSDEHLSAVLVWYGDWIRFHAIHHWYRAPCIYYQRASDVAEVVEASPIRDTLGLFYFYFYLQYPASKRPSYLQN